MKKYLWIVSLSLYFLAFNLPVYATTNGPAEVGQGFWMFVFGWMFSISELGLPQAWFANLFFIAALCTTWKFPITSTLLGIFSVLLALLFLTGGIIPLLNNRFGHENYLTEIHIGYWFWLGSMVVILIASVFRVIEKRKLNMK
jgi:hypothetical protein